MAIRDNYYDKQTYPVRIFINKQLAKQYVAQLREIADTHPFVSLEQPDYSDANTDKAVAVNKRLKKLEGRRRYYLVDTTFYRYYIAKRQIIKDVEPPNNTDTSYLEIDSEADEYDPEWEYALDEKYKYLLSCSIQKKDALEYREKCCRRNQHVILGTDK